MRVSRSDLEEFEWDEAKSSRNADLRGFDFEFAARVFAALFVEREDQRHEYGEPRFITTGKVEELLISVVWTPRDNARRIISAWPASRQERRMYREYRKKT